MTTLFTSWEWEQFLYVPSVLCAVTLLSATMVEWRLRHPRQGAVPRLSEADRAVEAPRVKQDGMSLHLRVPMERWCVTRDDLKQFRRLVKNAIAERRIVPTERDPFDPDDDVIGPCIHTVNTQYIMPVTQAAGGPSWALMKHPEGLPCDLFVTHGWAEGIYEFIDKVLNSWPRSSWRRPVRHAYCCMLSNPQNLDISQLCQTPEESPFYRALAAASDMLVVPNAKSSIYTRVWCAYEAFLGYSWGKRISTAVPPGRDYWLRTLQAALFLLTGYGVGIVLSVLFSFAGWEGARIVKNISQLAFFLSCSLYVAWRAFPGSVRFAAVRCAATASGGCFAASDGLLIPLDTVGAEAVLALTGFTAVASVLVLELDMVMAAQAVRETQELMNGFTGRLRDAKCSVAADGERIRKALAESGSEGDVDGAVEVLISMGTFTPRLREAVDRAGILSNVSRCNYPVFQVGLFLWSYIPLEHFTFQHCENVLFTWFSWALMLCWVLVTAFSPDDCRAYCVSTVLLTLPAAFVYWLDHTLGTVEDGSCKSDWALAGMSTLMVLLAVLGPAGTARVPLVGPLVVRLLLNCSHRRQTIKKREPAESAIEASDAAETVAV